MIWYTLSALSLALFLAAGFGLSYYTFQLLDRIQDANDRRRARAERYRQSRANHPAARNVRIWE